MNDKKSVTFKYKDGVLTVDAANHKGVGCGEIERALRAMGNEIETTIKPEFYEYDNTNSNVLTVNA